MRAGTQVALGIFLLAPISAIAGSNDPPMATSEYQKQEWHVEDGLSQNNVRTIIQLPNRQLLIGNSEGIASFDGTRFTPFRLSNGEENANEPVNALLITRNGDLWIGTDDRGVIRQRGGAIVNISEEAGFHQERVRALLEDRFGAVWIATHNGVERVIGEKVESLSELGIVPGDITQPFAQDTRGNIFIVTAKGLFVSNGSKTTPFPIAHKELGDVTAAYINKSGIVWIGRSRGLSKFVSDGRDGYREFALPLHGPVVALISDEDENLWIGTKAHGVCRITVDGLISHWKTEDGLPDNTIRTFFADDENNLWIGTLSGGLSRWRKSVLVPFGVPEGLPNSFAANVLADRRGNVWFGTWGSGLLRMRKGKLKQEHLPGLPFSDPIRSLAEDAQGNIWIGTWFDGVYRFDGNSFQHFLTGRESPSNAISVIYEDKRGALWLGTYRGLLRFAGGVPEKNKGELFLPETIITSLKEDQDGSLVIGTFKGLYRMRDGALEGITVANGLANSFILSVSTDSRGAIWVGTKGGGIDLIRGNRATHIPPSAGIPANPVFSVLDDGRGILWMNTSRGLLRVPRQQLEEVADGKRNAADSFLMGKNEGMRSSECGGVSQPPATRTSDGVLWFATAKGFVHTNPSEATFQLPALDVRVSGFQADRVDAVVSEKVSLKPGLGEFSVLFDAIRLSNPAQVQYRYKLEGYDKDWTIVSGRKALYRQLPPGQYRFLVSARDAGQPWSDAVAAVSVVQQPFLYQTAWFYLFVGLAVVSVVVALFRWRLARAKGRMRLVVEERNRIAREWHDTLMASLAAISWQLEATRERLNASENDVTRSLDLARSMVRHSQTEARRIIWDLQDETAAAGILSEVLSKVLDGLNTRTNISAKLRVSGQEAALSPVAIHHLACICQEAVSNAIRHGGPNAIHVGLEYGQSSVTLSVKDDGCGFNASKGKVPGHFGLSVMEERVRKLGGGLTIQSSPGAGTQVLVELPVVAEGA